MLALWATGLLVALRGACPNPYRQTQTQLPDGTPYSACCYNGNCNETAGGHVLDLQDMADMGYPLSESTLCFAATEMHSCCTGSDYFICFQPNYHSFQCMDGFEEVMDSLQSLPDTADVLPALNCLPHVGPKGQTSPKAIDGATVGTIVVVSLIGVALVGGAVAVHWEV
jgi:hypothetical protein